MSNPFFALRTALPLLSLLRRIEHALPARIPDRWLARRHDLAAAVRRPPPPRLLMRLSPIALALTAVLATTAVHARSSSYCASCARDSHGRIARSPEVREQFMRETGYPHGRPGYVIDHVKPLCHGGPDDVANMQWQTKADAAAKDKWECAR
jgi:hypothetical protein